MTLTDSRVLALLEDVIGLTDIEEFRLGVLHALLRMVPSEWASLNDFGPAPGDLAVVAIPDPPPWSYEPFDRYRHQHPIAQFHANTRDGRAYRFSDLISRRELRRLELFKEFYEPLGIHYQIAFTLPSDPQRLLAIALSRADRNYTDSERNLINRARPMLIQVFRNALEHHSLRSALGQRQREGSLAQHLRAAGLTQREAEIMQRLAHGTSKRDIAAALAISPRTVAKHLERCFRKLDVNSQSAAAKAVWALATDEQR